MFSALEFNENKNSMTNLIIDASRDEIFLKIIANSKSYTNNYPNSKNNFEKLIILIQEFMNTKSISFDNLDNIYINRGPGSFSGIRNSLSVIKGINFVKKTNYFCYSYFDLFETREDDTYLILENISDSFYIKNLDQNKFEMLNIDKLKNLQNKRLVFINLTDSSTNKIKTYFPQSCEFLKVDLEDIPNLCDKFKIKKNLINPLYIS